MLGDVDKRSAGAQPEAPDAAHRDVGEPAWTTWSVSASTMPSEPSERQPAASHTLALARTAPSGSRRGAASGVRAGAPGARLDPGGRSQVAHLLDNRFGAQLAMHLAVDHHDRSDAAGADAVRRQDRDLAVARGLSSPDAEASTMPSRSLVAPLM